MKAFRSRSFARRPALAVGLIGVAAVVAGAPHAPADASPCAGRYTVTVDTVLDNSTLLTWQRVADPTTRTWDTAQTYCQTLALAGGGWRLPTLLELQTLVDESVSAPSLDPVAFTAAGQTGIYWSSTESAEYMTSYWYVDFGLLQPGGYAFIDASAGLNRVRCVR